MDIVRELEAMRKRMLQEINTEFDVLLSRIAEDGAGESLREPARQ